MEHHSDCKSCPAAKACNAFAYRGSQCSAIRNSFGISEDPRTQYDNLFSLDMRIFASKLVVFSKNEQVFFTTDEKPFSSREEAVQHELEWLYSPCSRTDSERS